MLTSLSAHARILPEASAARRAVSLVRCHRRGAARMSGVSATQRVNQPGREEAVVRTDAHPVEHERPEEWGWHGEMGKWGRRLAVIPILFLLSMLIGNHQGRWEDLWLIGFAVLLTVILVWDARRRKNAWRSR